MTRIFITLFISSLSLSTWGQLRWQIVEKEASFLFGLTQHQNSAIPVEVMTNDNGFMANYQPISSGEQTFNPSYTRMYALRFGLRLFFNEHWFVRGGLGVQEQFFGYSNDFNHPRGSAQVTARTKYFGIPLDIGGGFSLPFYYPGEINRAVGAVNFYVGGFFTSLWSPRGQSEVLLNTVDSLDNGRQYLDFIEFEGIQSGRMRDVTSIFGGIGAISIEYNDVTFSIEYRRFIGNSMLNANPLNQPVFDQGVRTDWYGHSIEFGISFRFY